MQTQEAEASFTPAWLLPSGHMETDSVALYLLVLDFVVRLWEASSRPWQLKGQKVGLCRRRADGLKAPRDGDKYLRQGMSC